MANLPFSVLVSALVFGLQQVLSGKLSFEKFTLPVKAKNSPQEQ